MAFNILALDILYRMRYNMHMEKSDKSKYELLLLKNQLCFPMYSAANRIVNNYRPLLKNIDLTYTQYIVMMVMWEKERVNEKDLVDALHLKSNTLAPLLKKLESKGLVEVRQDENDKRNIVISITAKGRKIKEKAVEVPIKYSENFPLSKSEVQSLKKILCKIINWKIQGGKEL